MNGLPLAADWPSPSQAALLLLTIALLASAYRLVLRFVVATVPWQPRRSVPWNGLDVFVIILFFSFAVGFFMRIFAAEGHSMARPDDGHPSPIASGEMDASLEQTHPALQLVRNATTSDYLLILVATPLIIPISEEFLCRLVLQGWLEKVERQGRRVRYGGLAPALRRLPFGTVAVVVTSAFFAALHYREPSEVSVPVVRTAMWSMMCANLATIVLGVVYLRLRAGATWSDLGLERGHVVGDLRLGLLTFLAAAIPIYGIQAALVTLLPDVVPDPVTILLLAMLFGTLYLRTHRILPSIAMHVGLNATSTLLMLLFVQ